ncbi:MAG: c-type cytochrome domain-containing protein [Pirellulaceae bacterium]
MSEKQSAGKILRMLLFGAIGFGGAWGARLGYESFANTKVIRTAENSTAKSEGGVSDAPNASAEKVTAEEMPEIVTVETDTDNKTRVTNTAAIASTATDSPIESNFESLQQDVLALLGERCAECHAGEKSAEKTGSSFDVSIVSSLRDVVRAGRPDASSLLARIRDEPEYRMPPLDSGTEQLSADQASMIEDWILAMAPQRARLTLADELKLVVDDRRIAAKNPLRNSGTEFYVSLRVMFNRPDIDAADLDLARTSLVKLVNSLHWKPELIFPVAIDDDQTIYRIDLVELGWKEDTFLDLLDSVDQSYPYRIVPVEMEKDNEIRRAASHIVRHDWLVKQLTLPQTYHALLYGNVGVSRNVNGSSDSFQTLNDLLDFLQIDYQSHFSKPGGISRAFIDFGQGLETSEVSNNYRVLDRLMSILGPVWISYDFATSRNAQDIILKPWGPRAPERPDEVAFAQNGGEVIFQLPVGLHGYLVVDDSGNRIDQAPINIVHDKITAFDDQGAIATGVACMRCHADGFRSRTTIRPTGLQNKLVKPGSRPTIMDQPSMDALIVRDNVRYGEVISEIRSRLNLKEPESRESISTIVQIHNRSMDAHLYASELEQFSDDASINVMDSLKDSFGVKSSADDDSIEGDARDDNRAIDLTIMPADTVRRVIAVLANESASGTIERDDFEAIFPSAISHLGYRQIEFLP